ncbi:phosphoglycerate mutase [Halolactibacillus alkaliphilus]|uniref:Phosphoglycerate mutase n=1 Tax=Halolactibacillus alkaliphilus TaxID=442899 RepID=A0A511WZR9_9BACI|nr:histidine phosphatase family protein [Halolactibacillus alkaliphilus]GEN56181.1 phosphoglycerate mutase [Halolactibacillus alkaliphilus]GGN66706.1 phosphoglycerate mutase [Halolactibacillus alkaliphilus]SFO68228.1 2,3-bisphosphoglycerate-dependent phosphoglycerate mutase [Halolactibacillus alkaliphilus]
MKQLILIRHCHADGKHKDSPLTNLGVNQARRLAEYLDKEGIQPKKLLSSPYMRAVETIRPYARQYELAVIKDPRLQEQVLSDQPVDDYIGVVKASFSDPDYKLPGGESAKDALCRFKEVINEYSEEDASIAIVTHGHLLALYLHEINPDFNFKDWQVLKNPDVFIIHFDGEHQVVKHVW